MQAYLAFMDPYKMLSIPVINFGAFPCTCSSVNSSYMNTKQWNGTHYSSKIILMPSSLHYRKQFPHSLCITAHNVSFINLAKLNWRN